MIKIFLNSSFETIFLPYNLVKYRESCRRLKMNDDKVFKAKINAKGMYSKTGWGTEAPLNFWVFGNNLIIQILITSNSRQLKMIQAVMLLLWRQKMGNRHMRRWSDHKTRSLCGDLFSQRHCFWICFVDFAGI